MPLKGKNILAIDDTASIRTFLQISLQAYGAQFYGAQNAYEGVQLCRKVCPDIVILDLGLPDKDGLDILPEIKQQSDAEGNAPKVIILSVRKEKETKDKAFELGADQYVTKPFLVEDLVEVISHTL